MKNLRSTRVLGLTILTPVLAGNLQPAVAGQISPSFLNDQLSSRGGDEWFSSDLKNSLLRMTPEEKLQVGGDHIQIAQNSCDARSITGAKSKGACCSPSVKFRCVGRGESAGTVSHAGPGPVKNPIGGKPGPLGPPLGPHPVPTRPGPNY
jgi:hypothetical protein